MIFRGRRRKRLRSWTPRERSGSSMLPVLSYAHPIIELDSATGCRRGELLALTWPDLNLVMRIVEIKRSLEQTKAGLRLKTPKSGEPRTFPLPESAVEALKIHRERQQENRRLLGKGYRMDLDLVFATVDGNYLKPDSVTAAVCLLARKCGLPGIGLHSLRHTHGSQLLSEGVPLPVVSKRLGHANPSITARVYSHVLPGDEIRAAQTLGQPHAGALWYRNQSPSVYSVARRCGRCC